MPVRGIRGATTVAKNEESAIYGATLELLQTIAKLNGVRSDDVGYIWFTVTDDLNASFPADAINGPELVALADRGLYQAKARGRNRACHAPSTTVQG